MSLRKTQRSYCAVDADGNPIEPKEEAWESIGKVGDLSYSMYAPSPVIESLLACPFRSWRGDHQLFGLRLLLPRVAVLMEPVAAATGRR